MIHEHHAVGDLACEAELMGHDHHRHARPGELLHHGEHLTDELGIEGARWLVEQHQLRIHGERPGDGDALLLASRELGRIAVRLVGEADPVEQRPRLRVGSGGPLPEYLDRALGEVLQRGHVGKQVEALEHHGGLQALAHDLTLGERMKPVALPPVADQLAADPDRPGVDAGELINAAQQRRLAGTGTADDAQHLPRRDIERDATQCMTFAEALVNIADGNQWPVTGFADRAAHWAGLLLPSSGAGLATRHAQRRAMPRAKRRSSSTCSGVSTETTARYQMPATNSSSMTRELA
jgi:hypothetical protein